uniref:Uncharacterized protein n=1 Tax=Rhizophora mucronata TaxID=61149 RepID=A0A2P2PJ44_RHIMU
MLFQFWLCKSFAIICQYLMFCSNLFKPLRLI